MAPQTDPDLGTILGIWGHPDDEAYLSAGLMAEAVDAGRRVVCVTATRGEGGFADDDGRSVEERKAVRTAELEACLAALGVTEHRWLEYPDGGCGEVDDAEASARIAALIDEIRPDTILTFAPDGQTGHVDHMAVSRWTTRAFRDRRPPNTRLLYATVTPEWNAHFLATVPLEQVMMVDDLQPEATPVEDLAVWYVAEGEMLTRKLTALRSQASQIEPLIAQTGEQVFAELTRDEFFREPRADDWSAVSP
jgi:LmbE family N-acetylglucosaminyl deacetylase